ncbi:hypothetical protein QJS66_08800 [Kocuria rhizophila]|nr:hypothetical protein QJS66_08800 [Kocuria rhizophila]
MDSTTAVVTSRDAATARRGGTRRAQPHACSGCKLLRVPTRSSGPGLGPLRGHRESTEDTRSTEHPARHAHGPVPRIDPGPAPDPARRRCPLPPAVCTARATAATSSGTSC